MLTREDLLREAEKVQALVDARYSEWQRALGAQAAIRALLKIAEAKAAEKVTD